MRLSRITTQRTMILVFIVGATIGGVIEFERAEKRRNAYADRIWYVQHNADDILKRSTLYATQTAAIRRWVTEGFRGAPPPNMTWMDGAAMEVSFGPKEAEAFRRDPEKALLFASRLEKDAEHCRKLSAGRARLKRKLERSASFPWVLFARDLEPVGPGTLDRED